MNKHQKKIAKIAKKTRCEQLKNIKNEYKNNSKTESGCFDAMAYFNYICDDIDTKSNKHFRDLKRNIKKENKNENI